MSRAGAFVGRSRRSWRRFWARSTTRFDAGVWSAVACLLVWVGPLRRAAAGPPRLHGRRTPLLTGLLVVLAVFGPALAYAGVTIIYPSSSAGVDVDEDPPITFVPGGGHATAQNAGLAGPLIVNDNDGSWAITLYGLSGGTVVYNDLANVSVEGAVDTYRFEVAQALTGIVPVELRLRAYTGTTPPTADASPQVCAYLDLTAAQGTLSSGACSGSVRIQVAYTLPSGQTTQGGTVKVRPAAVTFA